MKTYIAFISVCILIATTGCKKFLDVEPKQVFSENLALTSIQGLQKTTIGAFDAMQSGSLYGGGFILNNEFMADWVDISRLGNDFTLNQFKSRSLNTFNGFANGTWNDAYRAINIANIVLDKLPQYEKDNPALALEIKGQCLFVRAVMHYELLKIFAQPSGFTADDSHLGIPLRLTPGNSTDGQNTPRSSVAQVYAQIVADLQAAETLLPATSPVVTKYAAQAFLAKVFFTQNKFQQAKDYADKVIGGPFTLYSTVPIEAMFGSSSAENEGIFKCYFNGDDLRSGGLVSFFNQPPAGSVFPPVTIDGAIVSFLESARNAGDLRVKGGIKKFIGTWATYKYTDNKSNTLVIRLAEMYLLRAECLAQLGAPDADVRADYNKVRVRAGLPADNSTTGKAALIATIRAERDIELCMEGDHYSEEKRRKGTFVIDGQIWQWNDPRLLFPIPQQEIDQNKKMVQNEGY